MAKNKQGKISQNNKAAPAAGRDYAPFVVFMVALAARLIHIAAFRHTPFFDSPVIDAQMYDTRAMNILNGIAGGKIFYQAPLYSYYLAAVYKIFGHDYMAPRIIQAFIGSLSCVLVFLIGKKTTNRSSGIIAGLAAAIYGPVIYYDGELLRPALVIFSALAAIWFLVEWREKKKLWMVAAAGAALGLSIITRENVAIFVPVAAWYVFSRSGRKVAPAALFLLCAALPVVPVTYHNYSLEKDFVPVSPQGGMNFYIGNSAESERLTALQPGIDWDRMAFSPREELGADAKSSEYSRWFFKKTMNDIEAVPMRWLRLMVKKFFLFWAGEELMPNADLLWIRNNSPILKVLTFKLWFLWIPFGAVAPLFVFGLIRGARKYPDTALLAGFVFSYMLSVVLFHVRARYRLPVAPVMLPVAAFGAVEFIRTLKSADSKKIIEAVAVVLACAVMTGGGMYMDTSFAHGFPTDYFIAKALDQKGVVAGAEEHYRKALEESPGYAELHHDYGQLLMKTNRMEAGAKEMEKARELAPDCAFIRKNLGQVYRKEADKLSARSAAGEGDGEAEAISRAIEEYEAAEKLDRFDISIKYDLALLYERAGRKADFKNKMSQYIELAEGVKGEEEWVRIAKKMMVGGSGYVVGDGGSGSDSGAETVKSHVDAAQYHMRGGNLSAAYDDLQAALAIDPGNAEAHALLGNYFKKKRQYDDAEREYLVALEAAPDNVLALNNLANLYRDEGKYEKAAEYYARALKLAPDNEVIKKNLAKLKEARNP